MLEKIGKFIEKYAGFIIGLLIGFILVVSNLTMFIVNVLVMILFGFLGKYIQDNKAKVKEKIKNLIEKW